MKCAELNDLQKVISKFGSSKRKFEKKNEKMKKKKRKTQKQPFPSYRLQFSYTTAASYCWHILKIFEMILVFGIALIQH